MFHNKPKMSKIVSLPGCFVILLSLLKSCQSQSQPQYIHNPIPDLCGSDSVQSAARISLPDGSNKLFISSGKHFWLLNVTGELPDHNNVQHLPFDFKPDVALMKDSTGCSSDGKLTLMLIEMKHSWNGKEAVWNTIEGWIDGNDLNWGPIQKIAYCDMSSKICTTTDNYFATMSFDWKHKLDSAFGIIGQTAYFIQDKNVYKVHYKNRCIKNPYKEVVSYSPFDLGTATTAAMSFVDESTNNFTVVLVDRDMNYNFTAKSLDDVHFAETISDGGLWSINGQDLFDQCPKVDSLLGFLAFDFFSSSSKHFSQRSMVLFMFSILIVLLLITVIVVGTTLLLMSRRGSPSGVYEINDEGLINHENNDNKVDSNDTGNNKEKKTFLQTSC